MDKMHKVRPVLDYVVEKFKELYQPEQNICIDEDMMQWIVSQVMVIHSCIISTIL